MSVRFLYTCKHFIVKRKDYIICKIDYSPTSVRASSNFELTLTSVRLILNAQLVSGHRTIVALLRIWKFIVCLPFSITGKIRIYEEIVINIYFLTSSFIWSIDLHFFHLFINSQLTPFTITLVNVHINTFSCEFS